jgi:hypothetical protein
MDSSAIPVFLAGPFPVLHASRVLKAEDQAELDLESDGEDEVELDVGILIGNMPNILASTAFALDDGWDRVQALVYTVGHPNPSINQVTELCDARIVPVTGPAIEKLIEDPRHVRAIDHAALAGAFPVEQCGADTTGERDAVLHDVGDSPQALDVLLVRDRDQLVHTFTSIHETLRRDASARAAEAILASLYVNAGVMRRDSPSATQYNSCQAVQITGGPTACDLAIAAVDRILALGAHTLQANWQSNFTADNHLSSEVLMAAKHVAAGGEMGMNFAQRALHYNQVSPDAWNGFSTIADVYNAFDANDARRQIFLVGPQVHLDPQNPSRYNQPINDRSGARLVYVPTIANVGGRLVGGSMGSSANWAARSWDAVEMASA